MSSCLIYHAHRIARLTTAFILSGSVGLSETGVRLDSRALTYALAVARRSLLRSIWKALCMARWNKTQTNYAFNLTCSTERSFTVDCGIFSNILMKLIMLVIETINNRFRKYFSCSGGRTDQQHFLALSGSGPHRAWFSWAHSDGCSGQLVGLGPSLCHQTQLFSLRFSQSDLHLDSTHKSTKLLWRRCVYHQTSIHGTKQSDSTFGGH